MPSNNSHNPHAPTPLLAVIDTDEPDLTKTIQMLAAADSVRVVGVARKLDEIPTLMSAEPDVALLDVGADGSHLPATLREILDTSPRCQVILTARPDTKIDLMKAVQLGARGLLHKPLAAAQVLETVTEVFQTELARTRRIEEQTKARVTQGRAGLVITVFSPKGGVGCTVVATHLAIALAEIEKSRVGLIDFDLQFGDAAVHLNLNSNHGVHELMRSIDEIDGAILNDVMVQHPASGVRVLLPPATFEQVEEISTEGMSAVVKAVRKAYDFVVVDTWHSLEDATLALIDLSDVVLVITTPEVPALRNTRRILDYLRERPDRRNKVRIVLNRYPSKNAVPIGDIERSLGATPMASIPSDGRLVTEAINAGITFLGQRVGAASAIKQLANTLAQPRLARLQRERMESEKGALAASRNGNRGK